MEPIIQDENPLVTRSGFVLNHKSDVIERRVTGWRRPRLALHSPPELGVWGKLGSKRSGSPSQWPEGFRLTLPFSVASENLLGPRKSLHLEGFIACTRGVGWRIMLCLLRTSAVISSSAVSRESQKLLTAIAGTETHQQSEFTLRIEPKYIICRVYLLFFFS